MSVTETVWNTFFGRSYHRIKYPKYAPTLDDERCAELGILSYGRIYEIALKAFRDFKTPETPNAQPDGYEPKQKTTPHLDLETSKKVDEIIDGLLHPTVVETPLNKL